MAQLNTVCTDKPIGRILNALENVYFNKNQYRAKCPVHQRPDSKSRTLSIKETADGNVLIHCFAGCHYEDVLDEMGMTKADLFPRMSGGDDWMYAERKRTRNLQQIIDDAKPSATLVYLFVNDVLKQKNWDVISRQLDLDRYDFDVMEGVAHDLREVLDA